VGDYELSLEVSLGSIPTVDASRMAVVEHIASLRCVVYGTTLRNWFAAMVNGSCADGPLVAVPHRNEQEFYLKPQAEQIAVVFPMHFADAKDAVIAQTFLAMFNEAKRQPALSTAPTCSYSKPGAPPLELTAEGASAKSLAANGGFVSFVLFKRHVEGAKLETAVWNMLSFYAFISFHIKCSKAHWHSRMRIRTDSMLRMLNRAKQEPFVKKEKKTATGRTFVRKDHIGGGLSMSGLNIKG
jgi:actin related protein 2/3 complex subunit 2